MKMAPVINEQRLRGFSQVCVHTGQHYDAAMSRVFFDELGLPQPDLYLGVGSDTHARQTARIMMEFEPFCLEKRPDLVVVAGDVNSTVAASLVASKLHIPVAHVEAGLRSFDKTMPEEVNRIVTDHLSELLFTTEESANINLAHEGIPDEKVHFVGNCMIDTLCRHLERAVDLRPWSSFNLAPERYALLTLHRPSNVDRFETMDRLCSAINEVSSDLPVLFPVHPRTKKQLTENRNPFRKGVILCEPLPYLMFLGLMSKAKFVLTDSGGIQEETTALGIPCLTLRANTERPSTVTMGTNRLIDPEGDGMHAAVEKILSDNWPKGTIPPLWDGLASKRIVEIISSFFHKS
jgi:UDP-N-acetylglucosamine 2-epimerase (non-hydrolysing)